MNRQKRQLTETHAYAAEDDSIEIWLQKKKCYQIKVFPDLIYIFAPEACENSHNFPTK